MDLTRDDIEVLLEALPEWERKGESGELVGDMMMALLGPKDETEHKAWLAKRDAEKAEKRAHQLEEKRLRKERSTILQAKLLQLRDRIDVNAVESALAKR